MVGGGSRCYTGLLMPALARPPASAPCAAECAAPDALAALRAATRDIHARLDSALPLAREQATLADYACHLQAIAGWLAAVDGAVGGSHEPPGWSARQQRRQALVTQDLQDCGAFVGTWPELPASPPLPFAGADYGWGVAYVVEGSQLGGTVLYRRLQATLAPRPLRYLRGEGGGPSPWPAFTAALRAAVSTPAGVAAACAGAVAAFDLLVQRFQQLEVAV